MTARTAVATASEADVTTRTLVLPSQRAYVVSLSRCRPVCEDLNDERRRASVARWVGYEFVDVSLLGANRTRRLLMTYPASRHGVGLVAVPGVA